MKKILLATSFIVISIFSINAQTLSSTVNSALATVPPLEPTDSLVLVNILITDYENIPEAEASFTIESPELKFKTKAVTDVEGRFQILLPKNSEYAVYIDKFGHTFAFDGKSKEKMKIPGPEGLTEFEQTFQIKLITTYYGSFSLEGVNFDSGKSNIKPESEEKLNKLAVYLKQNVTLKVEIGGHTDNVGDDKKNMTLSQRRCDSVREYLGKKGINPSRVLPKGYGESRPIADNATPEGRAKNRRIEAKIIEK